MKASIETQNEIQGYIVTMLDYFKSKGVNFAEYDFQNEGFIHLIYSHCSNTIRFDIKNPNVKKDNEGNRILPFNENFDHYVDNTNDKTLTTLLKKVFKNIEQRYKKLA